MGNLQEVGEYDVVIVSCGGTPQMFLFTQNN
jgi:hypothetical protein